MHGKILWPEKGVVCGLKSKHQITSPEGITHTSGCDGAALHVSSSVYLCSRCGAKRIVY